MGSSSLAENMSSKKTLSELVPRARQLEQVAHLLEYRSLFGNIGLSVAKPIRRAWNCRAQRHHPRGEIPQNKQMSESSSAISLATARHLGHSIGKACILTRGTIARTGVEGKGAQQCTVYRCNLT